MKRYQIEGTKVEYYEKHQQFVQLLIEYYTMNDKFMARASHRVTRKHRMLLLKMFRLIRDMRDLAKICRIEHMADWNYNNPEDTQYNFRVNPTTPEIQAEFKKKKQKESLKDELARIQSELDAMEDDDEPDDGEDDDDED